jgi:predicted transcriptional regulator
MIKQFNVSQKEAAQKLGVTPAAVCQYLSKRRGRFAISDEILLREVARAAKRIHEEEVTAGAETCRLCKLFVSKGFHIEAERSLILEKS